LGKAGFEDVNPKEFKGGVATVFCEDDQVAPAKITSKFADEYGVNIFGGILEQEFIPNDKVKDLAELPSKKQLKAQLVSALSSPMTGLVSSLSATSSDLVNVLDSIKEKKQD
jgi:large subunit ribosomal protein L10